ncbi:unnamed protein product [Triticum turgidum subsp. durum]|uniref:Uncharacterized protein n=1 Tax=Triticum turgidum subsp. durum TaxID=4567 RepID=A0A9R1B0D4_TRITD|nr:unnamed protein product [Triticum turgidum subsp. durum]
MARVYVGNLDPRATAREIEDEFRVFGVLKSVWVARKPPGFAFIDFDETRDAKDAIRELDGKNGWRVELSTKSGSGRGRERERSGGSDMKCYECGESGHFARECTAAVAVAQDTAGAQAMAEGATVHGIGLPGSEVTAGLHRLPVREAPAGLHRLPVGEASAGHRRLPVREASAGHLRLLATEASAGHHRLLVPEASASHHRLPVNGAIAGPQHSHPSARSPLMLITREHLVPQCWKCWGVGASACFLECFGMTIEWPGGRVLFFLGICVLLLLIQLRKRDFS